MKDIRLEVSSRVYRILIEFINNVGLRAFGIKSKQEGDKHILTIYTDRPGLVVGYHGERIERLLGKIHEDKLDENIDIVLEELDFFITLDNEPYSDEEQIDFMNDYMMSKGF